MKDYQYFVYLLASQRNGSLYIGVTNDLIRRIHEHKEHMVEGFSKKYNTTHLVYYETYGTVEQAIRREKQLKK